MTDIDATVERVAKAIYAAGFVPGTPTPCPGWCWEKAGPVQQQFARTQAMAAIIEYEKARREAVESQLSRI